VLHPPVPHLNRSDLLSLSVSSKPAHIPLSPHVFLLLRRLEIPGSAVRADFFPAPQGQDHLDLLSPLLEEAFRGKYSALVISGSSTPSFDFLHISPRTS